MGNCCEGIVGYIMTSVQNRPVEWVQEGLVAFRSFAYMKSAYGYSCHYTHSDLLLVLLDPIEQSAARQTVPGGPSVACSTAKAVEWDAAWSKNLDPSGRAALGVHEAAYEEPSAPKNVNHVNNSFQPFQEGIVGKTAAAVV